jgi:hypothetical protein
MDFKMKLKLFSKLTISILFFALSFNATAFTKSQKSISGLSKVYGYVAGQEATLNRIRNQLPELKSDVDLVQAEIESVYPNIKSKTSSKIIELLGSDGELLISSIDKKLQEVNTGDITKADAIRFLFTVRSRSAGNIENKDTKMFLYAINDYDNPVQELSSNKVVKFNTKNEEKAKGIELSISLPSSWEERQGNTPNTLRTWHSEAGSGTSSITLLVINSDDVMTKKSLTSKILSKNLQGLVPPNSKTSNVFQTDVSNQPGWMYKAELTTKRLENEIFINFKSLNVSYKGKIIQLNCGSAGMSSDVEAVKKEFIRIEKICDYAHNSLIIDSVYK